MEAKKKITAQPMQPMWAVTAEYGHYVKNEKDEGSSIFKDFEGSYDKTATDFGVVAILSTKEKTVAFTHQLYEKEFGNDAVLTERITKQGTYSAKIYERCETEEPFYYTEVRVSQMATDRTMDDSNIYDTLFG